jgi:glutathione S-transferase
LEGELGDKPYFEGDKLGCVVLWMLHLSLSIAGFMDTRHLDFSIEEECPKLIAWCKRCMQKESVSKSLADPQKIYIFMAELRKKFGLDQ